jgi:HD-GYP domain-containing protein (c-di-GMP phosphodiesterase class II)
MVRLSDEAPSPAIAHRSGDQLRRPDSLDDEGLRDLLEKVEEALESITIQVMVLERSPSDPYALDRVITAVRALQRYCSVSYLIGLAEILRAHDAFLAWVRSERTRFTFALGEALLLSLDQVKLKIEELKRRDLTGIGALRDIAALLEQITVVPVAELNQHLTAIIKLAGGDVADAIPLAHAKEIALPAIPPVPHTRLNLTALGGDLGFFRSVATVIDNRCPYWEHRTQTQLDLALGINRLLKKPVDVDQLTAAICLHDVGMIFLPPDLINKPRRFDTADERQLRDHVQWSYQWLCRISGWAEAAVMVVQHHERPDGTGYPAGEISAFLHDGAQIVAIADAFFSITHERADRASKKSLLRAIAEINAYRDMQFKGPIVDAFNALMRQLYAKPTAATLEGGTR